MNQHDRQFSGPPEAQVRYSHGDFKVTRNGAFVRCAATGRPIVLDDLKYWSVERQEAYASPEAVLQRLRELKDPAIYGR